MSPIRFGGSGGSLRPGGGGKIGHVAGGVFSQKWPPLTTTQPRLTITSSGIVQRAGTNYRTGGVNAFQLIHNDYPASRLMSHDEIDSLLNKASTLRAGIVRAHTLGVNIGSTPKHLVMGVTGTTTPVITYNSAVWEVMDYAVAAAALRGLYLMVPMVDELHYYHGGKANWVNLRRPGTCSLDGNVKSSNSTAQRAAENYFYTDAQIKTDFKKYISDWLNHVNQYTGRAYKDEPAIAIVETGNELWTADDFRTWTPEIAAHIKSIAPNVLVADGMAADGSAYWASLNPPQDPIEHIVTTEALNSSAVNIVGIHPYSVFTAADITTAAGRAAAKGKAFLVGEYAWSKTTAPGIEQAARNAPNVVATAFWSLQNDADLHNNGAGYDIDDASFYVPGKDSTQVAAVARVQAHAQALIGGSISIASEGFPGSSLPSSWFSSGWSGYTAVASSGRLVLTPPNTAWMGKAVALWTGMPAVTNQDVRGTLYFPTIKQQYDLIAIRAYDVSPGGDGFYPRDGYVFEFNPGAATWSISRYRDDVGTNLSGNINFTFPAATEIKFLFSAQGATISLKLWTGATEPASWTWQATDPNPYLSPGRILVSASNGGTPPCPVHVGALTVNSPDPIAAAASLADSTRPYGGPSGSWAKAFSDEFTAASLDTTRWTTLNGNTMNGVTLQTANVTQSAGELHLRTPDATHGAAISSDKPAGAGVNAYQFPVGHYIEARVYFPGTGTDAYNWPAFWVSGPNWPTNGEIDIAEVLGGKLTVNYHYGTDYDTGHRALNLGAPTGAWLNAYHVYGAHRRPGRVDVYWDGRLVRSFPTDDAGGAQQVLANIGAGSPSSFGASADLKLDWIRGWSPT